MKELSLLFIFLIINVNITMGQSTDCDSIVIYTFANFKDNSSDRSYTRNAFLINYWKQIRENKKSVYIITIKEQREIQALLQALNSLVPQKTLVVDAEHIYYEISSNGTIIKEVDAINNKLCLIMYYRHKSEKIIWISDNYIDRGKKRYVLNEKVKKVISKYCSIWKSDE